ncbi:MAG TPA: hypothetical protein VJZ26_14160, partial [Blastocatellia bacterium]|nr:hypothetical protein [Blastocatellia bacterium]
YVDQDQTNLSTILSSVDYAIFYSGDVNGELDLTLSNAGLRLSKVLVDDRQHLAGVNHQFSPATKLYGPYRLYSRQPTPDGH